MKKEHQKTNVFKRCRQEDCSLSSSDFTINLKQIEEHGYELDTTSAEKAKSELKDETIITPPVRSFEKRPIDAAKLLFFNGEILEYPIYRASIIQRVINKAEYDTSEKYWAIYETLCPAARHFIAAINPERPDLQLLIERLDRQYLNGNNVTETLLLKVKKLPNLYQQSPFRHWLQYQHLVQGLLQRIEGNHIDKTAERELRVELLKKLDKEDCRYARMRPDTLQALAESVEKFMNRTRQSFTENEYESVVSKGNYRYPYQKDNTVWRGKAIEPRRNETLHTRVTTLYPPCLFCGDEHAMENCPVSFNLKRKRIQEQKRCWRCLKPYNQNHFCVGNCRKCRRPHHLSLCPYNQSANYQGERSFSRQVNYNSRQREQEPSAEVFLPSMRLRAGSRVSKFVTIRALLDQASTASYISESLARALKVNIENVSPRTVHAFGGVAHVIVNQKTQIILINNQESVTMEFLLMPQNVIDPITVPDNSIKDWCLKRGVYLDTIDAKREEVDLIIGVVHFNLHFLKPLQKSVQLTPSLTAVDTKFGWYLQGQIRNSKPASIKSLVQVSLQHQCNCQNLNNIFYDPLSSTQAGDQTTEQWIKEFLEKVRFDPNEKRWVVPLPWLNLSLRPHNNREGAYKMAKVQMWRLRNRDQRLQYDQAIEEYLEGDYAERVYDDPILAYYLPHHHVLKPGSTTEIRIVMNASFSEPSQKSLNDVLYKGYSAQNNLFSLLIRWRTNPYVIIADLKKAFLQIRIEPKDRPFLRYFWVYPGTDKLVTYQFKSVIFGANSSPFLLYAVLRKIFEESPNVKVKQMIRSFYMDDVFFLSHSEEDLKQIVDIVTNMLSNSSFEMHKWASPKWMKSKEFRFENIKNIVSCLGMRWDLEEDEICFSRIDTQVENLTRRNIAQVCGRLFDPLGLLGPFITRIKLVMRNVTQQSKGWDSPLAGEVINQVRQLFKEIEKIQNIKIPRATVRNKNYELIGFADACKEAYGSVIYLHESDSEKMYLLVSKSRLVSGKRTIPELELCASVLLIELFISIKADISENTKVRFYTDSMVTLGRIKNATPNKFDSFIGRRLNIIQENSNAEQWHHINSSQNPADSLSRGLSVDELKKSDLWFFGPTINILNAAPKGIYTLITRLQKVETFNLENKLTSMEYDALIRFLTQYYRSMEKWFKLATRENEGKDRKLSLEHLAMASAWRLFQRVALTEEVNYLKKGKELPRTSKLFGKPLFFDGHGVMRLKRRLEHAALDFEAKYPIIATDHPFVRGFIRHYHSFKLAHASTRRTQVEIDNILYLPHSLEVVKAVIKTCQRCQWLRGLPFEAPVAQLPEDRVANPDKLPFRHIGIDLFGPIKAPQSKKRYGMIFTCCNTRAIHLELLSSKSTNSIIKSFRRFVSRRGRPWIVRSDNEKGFRKANPMLHGIFTDLMKCASELERSYSFQWIFQPPKAPFWGGFFERMIGVTKSTLSNWPLIRKYTEEEMNTILCEVEALVNSRPITTSAIDSTPLTPAHFLIGRSLCYVPPVPMTQEAQVDDALINYTELSHQRDALWSRLQYEYLVSLRIFHRKRHTREPRIGELVLIVAPKKRIDWLWGKIESIQNSNDKTPRTAIVRMPNGCQWERPIQALIPLEAAA